MTREYIFSIWNILFLLLLLPLSAADISSTYENNRVALGGGGYITGTRFNPIAKDQLYARGDCTGFFKWVPDTTTPAGGHWQQLCDFFGGNQKYMYGCWAFDFDPTNVNTIYAAFGINIDPYGGSSSPGVYKSTNAGQTWTNILGTKVGANDAQARTYGNSLAVDPNNGQVIYYGSQEWVNPYASGGPTVVGGLYETTNGGTNWTVNSSAPFGVPITSGNIYNQSDGPRTVLCDPRQGTISVSGVTRTKVVYLGYRASVSGEPSFAGGIYQSVDGGQTFSLMTGGPSNPCNIVLDGGTGTKLVVTTLDHGIWIYQSGAWTTGVSTGTDSYGGEISGIGVDPFNSNQLLARGNERLFRSTNGGTSWTAGSRGTTDTVVTYSDNVWTYTFGGGGGNIAFDPFRQGTAFEGDSFSVCRTSNVWASNAIWNPMIYGLETTASLWMTCPPAPSKNLLLYGCEDVRGFEFTNLGVYPTPAQQIPADPNNDGGTYDRCFAVCEQQPTHIVSVKVNPPKGVFTSADDGKTWVQQFDPPNSTYNAGLQVAVSATIPDHVVFLDPNQGPSYTTTMFSAGALAATWTASTINLSGYTVSAGGLFDSNLSGLASDKVTEDKFYLDASSSSGSGTNRVYVSTDGGKTFTAPANQSVPWSGEARLMTTPGVANDLYAFLGGPNNEHPGILWHSIDGAVTWSKIADDSNFNAYNSFALGCPAPSTSYPTLYVVGQYKGSWGVFRSINGGTSFDQISNDANIGTVSGARGYSNSWAVQGDRQTFGRVYINNDCTSISYLQPVGTGTGTGSSTLFYEGFAYTPGNLTGNGGWAGPTAYQVQSGGLSYTDSTGASLTTSGNSAAVSGYYPGGINKTLPTTIGAAGTTSYWSFIYTGGANDSYSLTDSTGHSVAGVNAINGTWQIYANGQWNNSGVTASGSAFLVVRLDFSSSGTQYRLYVNPKLSNEAANTPAVNVSDTHTGTISGINWYEAYYTNQALDEIRVANTWAAAAPSSGFSFYEGFAYSAGNLTGNGGWSGPNAYQVQSGGLSYTDSTGAVLPVSGNSAKVSSYYPGGINKTLPSTIGTPGTTAYWSSLYTGGSNDSYSLIDTNGHSVGGVNVINGTWQIYANGQWNNSGVTASGSAFLVVRLDFSASGTQYRLYVNPKLSSEAANTPAVNVSDSYTGNINGINWYEAYYTNQALDEIRLGSTWSVAVP